VAAGEINPEINLWPVCPGQVEAHAAEDRTAHGQTAFAGARDVLQEARHGARTCSSAGRWRW
jgi:hypothetical protein